MQTILIKLRGEFDLSNCALMRDAFFACDSARRVIVDFENVSYIDSSTLKTVIDFRRSLSDRGAELILAGVRGGPARVIEICGLNDFFALRPSVAQMDGEVTGPDVALTTFEVTAPALA